MTKIQTRLRSRVFITALGIVAAASLPAAYAAPTTAQRVCINKANGAALVKSECTTLELTFSEQSYSVGRDRIVHVGTKGAKYKSVTAALIAVQRLRPSATSPVVVRIGPGTFTLSDPTIIPSDVTVEGAGREATTLNTSPTHGLLLESNTTLRKITVKGALNVDAGAVINKPQAGGSVTLEDLGVTVSGTFWNQRAIYLTDATSTIRNVRITGPANSAGGCGIELSQGSATIENSTIDLAGITTGISINNAGDVTVRNTTINLNTLRSGEQATGILVGGITTKLFVDGLKLKADGSLGQISTGVYVSGSVGEALIVNSSLDTIGATAGTVEAGDGGAAQVLNSRLTASGTNPPVGAVGASTVKVAGTLLSGGAPFLDSGGTVTCAGVYDENFAFSASSCP